MDAKSLILGVALMSLLGCGVAGVAVALGAHWPVTLLFSLAAASLGFIMGTVDT